MKKKQLFEKLAILFDVKETESDSSELYNWISFKPLITINEGVPLFIKWFKSYNKI